jgi:hypothetical protein
MPGQPTVRCREVMIACLYHWYTAGLYASPVILVGGWLFFASRRDRRRDDRDGGGPPDAGAPAQLAS